MKKKWLLSLAMALALCACALPALAAGGDVALDGKNFPDEAFRAYVAENFDTDKNGALSAAERENVIGLYLSKESIGSLVGIEHFPNLASLSCDYNLLEELDVSRNPKLEDLDCSYNQLKVLKLNGAAALKYLYCSNNQLTALDVSHNPKLENLLCRYNQLKVLKLNGTAALKYLSCEYNQLTALDASGCPALTDLYCNDNALTALDLGKCAKLINLYCDENKLTKLDVSKNTALRYLACGQNQLKVLKLNGAAALQDLYCDRNQLTALDASGCPALTDLYCYDNALTALDVGKCAKLINLYCDENKLTKLDVSKNTVLKYLSCGRNQLTGLDLTHNTVLTYLSCPLNCMPVLDIGNVRSLTQLTCLTQTITAKAVFNGSEWQVDLGKLVGTANVKNIKRVKDFNGNELTFAGGIVTIPGEAGTLPALITYYYATGYTAGTIREKEMDVDVILQKGTLDSFLAAPKLTKVENGAKGIKITWGEVSGAPKYRVFYKTGGGSWKKLVDTTATSYAWTKAKNNTKYAFTVRCLSADGKSYMSSYDTTGKSITYLTVPKLGSLSATATSVKISWGKVTGAAKYRVFYKTGSGSWKKAGDTTGTSYTWKKAKANTKYTFTVRCLSKDSKSYTSYYNTTGKSIKTQLATPAISKLENTNTGLKISWGKVSGAAKYRIFYLKGGKWTKLADTTSTSYTWKKAKSGTKYTFTVRCLSANGKSYTSAYNTTGKGIIYLSPVKLKVAKASKGVKLTWTKSGGATGYYVYRKTGNGSYQKIATVKKAVSVTYTDKTAKAGKTYTYAVRAYKSGGYRSDYTGVKIKR